MYCKYCGKEISDNALFCKFCGNKRLPHNNVTATNIISENLPSNHGKSPKKKRKAPIILAVILLVAAALFFYGIFYINDVSVKTPADMNASDYTWNETPSYISDRQQAEIDEYIESMKEMSSDIEGWTVFDKYKYGLSTVDGSDTDKDGLTDKEEIEKYGTDPLKCSTADDLYTDGYKAQNGIDLFVPIEYDGDSEKTDESGAIKIFMKTPWDISATIIDVTEEYREEDCNLLYKLPREFYYAYKVCAYDNDTIEVDLGYFANELNKQVEELDIEANSLRGNSYNTSRKGSSITINFEDVEPFDTGIGMKSYDVFIVDKKDNNNQIPIISNLMNYGETISDTLSGENYTGAVSVIPDSEIGDYVEDYIKRNGLDPSFGKATHRALFLLGSYDATEEEKNALLAAGEYIYYLNYGEKVHLTGDDISYFSKEEVKQRFKNYKGSERKGLCKFLDSQFDGDWPELNQWNGFFYCWTSNEYLKNDSVKDLMENRIYEEHDPHFCIKDEFRFENYKTDVFPDVENNELKKHAVCAGMAQIAAEVYNSEDNRIQNPKDTVDFQTKYNDEFITRTASYDITSREGMKTFFDRYLNDFSLNNSEDKEEFEKMVSCYWARTNIVIYESSNHGWSSYLNSKDNHNLNWETVEKATEYLDNYQALLCTININNNSDGGHCVNLVSYNRGKSIGDDGKEYEIVTFDVYDSNYPRKYLKLVCYKIPLTDGRYSVFYKYNPCCKDYFASYTGDSYEYNPKIEDDIIKICQLGIFTDKGQCLNIKI